ncbi:MAG: DegT/DnrJ/EryC1/StrS family aminotransferase [Burkholderiales bacterium]
MQSIPTAFPPTPRLPVFGWATLSGEKAAALPCLLDHDRIVYTTSGRASILLALEQLGVTQGDLVLMPTYHCPSMIAPVQELGAQTVFYPTTTSGAPDMQWLALFDSRGVKAMLAAHFFGLPQPMAAIRQWCDERRIALIEDCAHALFGRSQDRPIGHWGDVAIGSLTKFLPVPEGGCWVSNRSTLSPPVLNPCGPMVHVKAGIDVVDVGVTYQRLAGLNGVLRCFFALMRRLRPATASAAPTQSPMPLSEDGQAMDGFTIDSALAHRQLSHPSRWVSQATPRERNVALRRRNYKLFLKLLPTTAALRPLFPELPEHSAPYVFPLWVQNPDPGYARLRAMQFPVSRWDRLWPGVPVMPSDAGIGWSHHVLQLACHQDLAENDIRRICEVLKALFGDTNESTT